MAPVHQSSLLRTLALPRTASRTTLSSRPLNLSIIRHYAVQSYGGGEGDPKGENPQDQGSSPATSKAEHPGPAPPDVGQGTGGGANKEGSHGNDSSNAASRGEGGQHGASAGSRAEAAPQPKIHKQDAPHPDDHSDEVKRHNEEMAKRHK